MGRRINVSYREDWCYESTRLLFCNAVIANPVFLQICNLRLNISWMWSWILQTSPLWTTSGTSWAMSALFRLHMASWISQTSMSPQVRTEITQLRPSYCIVPSIHCSRLPWQCSKRVPETRKPPPLCQVSTQTKLILYKSQAIIVQYFCYPNCFPESKQNYKLQK